MDEEKNDNQIKLYNKKTNNDTFTTLHNRVNILNFLKDNEISKFRKINNRFIKKYSFYRSFELEAFKIEIDDTLEDVLIKLLEIYARDIKSFEAIDRVYREYLMHIGHAPLELTEIADKNNLLENAKYYINRNKVAVILLYNGYPKRFSNVSAYVEDPNFKLQYSFSEFANKDYLKKRTFTFSKIIKDIIDLEYNEIAPRCSFGNIDSFVFGSDASLDNITIHLNYFKMSYYEFKVVCYFLTLGKITNLHLRNVNLKTPMLLLLKKCNFTNLVLLDISENKGITNDVFNILDSFEIKNKKMHFLCSNININKKDLFTLAKSKFAISIQKLSCHLDNETIFNYTYNPVYAGGHPSSYRMIIAPNEFSRDYKKFSIADFYLFPNLTDLECNFNSNSVITFVHRAREINVSKRKSLPYYRNIGNFGSFDNYYLI